MTTPHRLAYDLGQLDPIADPGTGNSFDVKGRSMVVVEMVSAAASETRTLPIPAATGQMMTIIHGVDGGDIDITVTSGYNEAGTTTMNTATAGDFVTFYSVKTAATTYRWRILGYEGFTGITEVEAGNQTIDGTLTVTGATTLSSTLAVTGASTLTGLTSLDGNQMTAGTGITTGTDTVCVSSCVTTAGLIKTTVYLDLDGLRSTGADDVIGVDGTSLDCHLGQITSARSGTIVHGSITCIETPAGGDPDVDLYASTDSTGSESDDITALAGTGILLNHGDWTGVIATPILLTAFPAVNEYLYVGAGAATDVEYTAGIFLIELYGTA